ncbi:DUF4352 domain-containing protein [Schumannella soli]|uniref:DUF4352 domain-containing protein n=1 Tax=Schumannella soli TaxID=2590779 RepID=A0A506XTB6_9MICO|nr:DUF4352 domain-containing protein [Schumannella soli]TPW76054.1 DUF4352 domain-containing protein [Schumannella soli]
MKRGVRIAASLAGLAIAMIAAATAPQDGTDIAAPFLVRGVEGDVLTTRLLTTRLDGIELADALEQDAYSSPRIDTEGQWLVVHLTVQTRQSTEGLSAARLLLDGREYGNYIGADDDLARIQNGPGIATSGTLVFELPADALRGAGAGHAELRLQTQVAPTLDDVPTYTLDLRGAHRSAEFRIPRPRVVEPLT